MIELSNTCQVVGEVMTLLPPLLAVEARWAARLPGAGPGGVAADEAEVRLLSNRSSMVRATVCRSWWNRLQARAKVGKGAKHNSGPT